MDISTVSRVVNGKYVQTDHGVFELKYFFNAAIERSGGEALASESIKERIRQIELIALQKLRQSLSAQEFELLTG